MAATKGDTVSERQVVKTYCDGYCEFIEGMFKVVVWPNITSIYPPCKAVVNDSGKIDIWSYPSQKYIGHGLPQFAIEIRKIKGKESERIFLADEITTGDNTETGEECGFIKHRNWSAKEKNNMKVDADDLKGDSEVNKEDPMIVAAEELYKKVRAEFL